MQRNWQKKKFLEEQKSVNFELIVVSFNLRKVLATPHMDSMLVEYSRKYAVYNFTIYETGSRCSICYVWSEIDGTRGSNEIFLNLFEYLKRRDQLENIQKMSLYCDNCPGQIKNK